MLCIPMDHSLTVGPIAGLEDTEETINQIARGGATAFLVQKGIIKSLSKPVPIGMIIQLSASTTLGMAPNRKVLIASVAREHQAGRRRDIDTRQHRREGGARDAAAARDGLGRVRLALHTLHSDDVPAGREHQGPLGPRGRRARRENRRGGGRGHREDGLHREPGDVQGGRAESAPSRWSSREARRPTPTRRC